MSTARSLIVRSFVDHVFCTLFMSNARSLIVCRCLDQVFCALSCPTQGYSSSVVLLTMCSALFSCTTQGYSSSVVLLTMRSARGLWLKFSLLLGNGTPSLQRWRQEAQGSDGGTEARLQRRLSISSTTMDLVRSIRKNSKWPCVRSVSSPKRKRSRR